MKINTGHFRGAQIALTGLTFCLAVAVLGTAADTLAVYNSDHSTNPWWLPLWSDHFDVHGTSGLIASATAVIIFNGVFLIFMLVPRFSLVGRPTVRAALALATGFPTVVVTLCTVVYAHILNHAGGFDTIQTWTCKFSNSKPVDASSNIPNNQSNSTFSRLCAESKFALYATLIILILQCFAICFAVVCWVADICSNRKAKKQSKNEWQDASSLEMAGRS